MNHLGDSLSPYLLAHRDDPVDWRPWGADAFGLARRLERPILLSIGYAACHWCHVMQRESFQDPELALAINRDFVAIKVDREELPDVDQVYQAVGQAVTGQGGWPLTAFLTPDLRPFHIGTYIPPKRRYGRPGLDEVLKAVAKAYRTRRDEVEAVARSWSDAARSPLPRRTAMPPGDAETGLRRGAEALLGAFDAKHGGFGSAPKFPQAPSLSLLLRADLRLGEERFLAAAGQTLRAMARGGIHDQLGGGFHRYAVDAAWQVPHFEKMLEDQALLAPLYVRYWQRTGEAWALGVAQGALRYVDEVLSDPAGGFWISQDADSPGGEGAFYRFPAAETERLLGPEAQIASLHYGLDDPDLAREGVLQDAREPSDIARRLGRAEDDVVQALAAAQAALRARRAARTPPACDRKVLAGPVGLAVSAFAELGAVTGEPAWRLRAERAAQFCLDHLVQEDGTLHRRYFAGRSGIPGYLEDYASLGQGFLDLYLAAGDLHWLDASLRLARTALDLFWDEKEGVLYSAALAAQTPLSRPQDRFDGARPAAQSRMLRLLLLLGSFRPELRAGEVAEALLQHEQAIWSDHPEASPSLVEVRDLYLVGPEELTVAAAPEDPAGEAWLAALRRSARADLIATRVVPKRDFALWQGKAPVDGRATLYACRLGVCSRPLHDLPAALAFLDRATQAVDGDA